MRKSARDLITSLVVVIVMAALLGFFGWATNGFKNVDRFKEWFGMAQTELDKLIDGDKSDESEKDASEARARNSGVYHDSDFGEAVIDVQKHPMPLFQIVDGDNGNSVVVIDSNGADIASVTVSVYYTYDVLINSYEFDYGDNGQVRKPVRDFISECELAWGDTYHIYIRHEASGDYLSNGTNFYVGVPDEDKFSPDVVFDGTQLSIGMPYDYYWSDRSGSGLPSYHSSLYIQVYAMSDIDKVYSVGLNYSKYNGGIPAGADENNYGYDYDNHFMNNSPFTLVTGSDSAIIIELAGLPFIGTHFGTCVVDIRSMYSYSYYGGILLCNLPKHVYFDNSKLAAPTNIELNSGTLSWNYDSVVEYGFSVFDGDTLLATVDEPKLDLNDYSLEEGEHTFRIRALGNVGNSLARSAVMSLTAYNASANITQLVAMTYYIGDDTVTKFVPLGKQIGDYLYDVEVDGAVFGGWYKDSGYSLVVEPTDKVTGDVSVYARLSAVEVTDRPVSWWERNMWYVLGPIIGLVVISAVAAVIKVVHDRKAA